MRVAMLVLAAACGRIGFDDHGDAGHPPGIGRWAKVAVSDAATCAITTTAELWCWGFDYYGQLGIGSVTVTAPPTKVGDGWRDVAVAEDHACGVQVDGSLWCWGIDDHGQLADN